MATARLLLHSGGGAADLERLRAVRTPPSTRTYTAVPFDELRDRVVTSAEARGLAVIDERWGLARADRRAFGVITLCDTSATDELSMGMAIGVRSSHDQSLPVGLCAGSQVFVCDNLMFTAMGLVEMRRHSRHAWPDIDSMVERVLDALPATHTYLQSMRDALMGTPVEDEGGMEALGVMYGRKVITNRQFTVAMKHWLQPPDAFVDRSAWSLYNSVTEGLKHGEAGTLLGRHMDAEAWVRDRWVA